MKEIHAFSFLAIQSYTCNTLIDTSLSSMLFPLFFGTSLQDSSCADSRKMMTQISFQRLVQLSPSLSLSPYLPTSLPNWLFSLPDYIFLLAVVFCVIKV